MFTQATACLQRHDDSGSGGLAGLAPARDPYSLPSYDAALSAFRANKYSPIPRVSETDYTTPEHFHDWHRILIDERGKADPLVKLPLPSSGPQHGGAIGWCAYYKDLSLSNPSLSGFGELARLLDPPLVPSPQVSVRQGIKERLDLAQRILDADPDTAHLQLVVIDGHRTLETQRKLFDAYRNYLVSENPRLSDEELDRMTELLVSKPPTEELLRTRPNHHFTGGAVDVVLVHKSRIDPENPNWLENAIVPFGSQYDEFSHSEHGDKRNSLHFYEGAGPNQREVMHYRRLLHALMRAVGFTPYAYGSEFWHWQCGNQMDAMLKGLPSAIYGYLKGDS